MVRCIACGICGFYVDLLKGLQWYEMDRSTRRAFDLNKEHNPPGQNPGTGHWNYIRCSKYLQEWADWDDGVPSDTILRDALLKERDCNGFTEYKPGFMPQEHLSFNQSDASGTREELEYDVFLSHVAEDDELAARVTELLRASDIQVFATGPGFPTGMWSDEVRAALEEAEHFWLLLTEKALDRSVYVHHEFGYFFGYHRHKNSSVDIRVLAKRLRYLLKKGDGRRPGMYQHFQDFPIDDFDDPVGIARIIAKEIGSTFKEPENPEELRVSASGWMAIPPEGLDDMRITRASSGAASDYSYGTLTIDVYSPKPIFNVSAVTWHPEVHVWPLKPVPQIGSGQKQQLSLTVQWETGTEPPKDVQDSHERRFSLHRPRDPGLPWGPLYITFETQSGQIWAAVTYMQVERQRHGHPETQLLHGPNPYGWVSGQKVSG